MAKERKASVIYEGNASQLVYAFPFDYLRKKFVKVEDIYTNITELTIGVDYTVEDKQVRLVKGIPLGHSVKIYRETTTNPLVEWQDASVLRSADLSLQEVQLLHLAEEIYDKVFDSGMSTAYGNPNCWDGQYKRIINALDPIEDGDVVTLRYIKANQDSLLNQLKNTGATQNSSIVSTGDTQNARLTSTGDTQNTRLNTTGDTQDKRLNDLGQKYVDIMTTLKDTATTKATEASNSAELSKKWAMSDTSPDGVTGNKSSKTWAGEAKTSASNSASSASSSQSSANASQTSATQSASSANTASQKASASASSASAAASSASNAATSASNAKMSETKAANSASAAAQSAKEAATFDPTFYLKGESTLGVGTDSNPQVISIPVKKGLYPIIGYPDGFDSTTALYPYALVANFQGNERGKDAGTLISLYASDNAKHLYFRTGWRDIGWKKPWFKLANVDDIPTKTSQLTDDRGLTTTNELNAEVQKWKDAYNNLRKRSCPVEFDEDELTLLASNLPTQTSPLNLSKPYTDFDGLYIIYGDADGVTSEYIATKQIQERIHFGKPYWFLLLGVGGLYTKCDSRAITTPSSIAILFNNIYIYRVYGVKLKEIT